jgi:hypothetical protein
MRAIKTALEIAIEKTENVKSNKASIGIFEAKQRGKKLANAFLAGDIDLTDEIKKTTSSTEQKESLKQGILDVLISQITLPTGNKETDNQIETIGKGLQILSEDKKNKTDTKKLTTLFQQLVQVFSRYLHEASQYEQAIRQQYNPKLRQKEEELSRRIGREVRIDPLQDPEFIAFYNQHMTALKNNYEPVVEQAKTEFRQMFENE